MYFPHFEEEEKFREVKIACSTTGCNGVVVHRSPLFDLSPRVEEGCPNCGHFMSRKLGNIEEERILSNDVVEDPPIYWDEY